MAHTDPSAISGESRRLIRPGAAPHLPGKILFLTRSLERGGAERQLVTLASALHANGVDIGVITFYAGGPLRSDLEAAGVKVLDIGKRGRWDNMSFCFRLLRLLRAEVPLVLHGYLGVANVIVALLKLVLPSTRIVWGVRASDMDLSHYDWLSRVVWWLECRLSGFPDLIIANSRAGRNHVVASGFPVHKTRVIANGIDTRLYHFDPEGRREIRAKWEIQAHETLIGLTGRLDPMKGHATFLDAAARLATSHPGLRFVCIGDGAVRYRQELARRADALGLSSAMLWAGAVDDMAAAYSALDIAVSASHFGEGFSNAIAEAMACERPCVVTDVGDSARIVGDADLVAPAADASTLALAMARLVDMGVSQRLALGAAARARVVAEFSVERLVQSTLNALEGVACA